MSNDRLISPLAITAGDPAGIGPELCVQLAWAGLTIPFVVIADKNLLLQRAQQLGLVLKIFDFQCELESLPLGSLVVLHVPLVVPAQAGELNVANSQYVLDTLSRAVQGCQNGEFSGMVTAPVHKGIINQAGIPFTGHTEFLAAATHTKHVVMMLVGGNMRVALVTTHLPLKEVPAAINKCLLETVLRILCRDLECRFGIVNPRVLVAGLNPHAGENGYLGCEERDVMIPVLDKLRAEGFNLSAPLPADTIFTPKNLEFCDAILTMYHDQGLPVLKHASFGQGVNVTLGMPIIRTSVDHGTALELAGTGTADSSSLIQAINVAAQMVLSDRAKHV